MKGQSSISIYGKTDMGRIRTNNEDAFVAQSLWNNKTYLAIAIDGVGGYEGGEIAAGIAQKIIPEYLSESPNGERVELLKQAVTAANNAIYDARQNDSAHNQMSCVLTAAIIDVENRQISMAHVGDSRLYSFHHGKLNKLSHDHSLVGYREEIGDLTEEEAMHHPQRNVIGRDVGSQKHKVNDEDFIESQTFPLEPNTILLLCSDGLTDMITSSLIIEILRSDDNLKEKANTLIKSALDTGGKDNVTVVLAEYKEDEPEIEISEKETVDTLLTDQIINETIDNDKVMVPNITSKKPIISTLYIIFSLLVGVLLIFYIMNYKQSKYDLDLNKERLEFLQWQNDSLEKIIKDSEEKIEQLENEVNILLEQIEL